MPDRLQTDFGSRAELVQHVARIAPWQKDFTVSPFRGGQQAAEQRLSQLDTPHYGNTRNYLDGNVTRLSAYIRHGILSLDRVRNTALQQNTSPARAEKFIQQLAWRDYWQRIYHRHPEWLWRDIEHYKTGWQAQDYADELPGDIENGNTGVACIDRFIHDLLDTGYMHNHARLYVAAYVVHWRRIRWQAGARWFLHHLIDGDPACNNLSWQWVSSTFSNKPYIFNLANVRKYASADIDTSAHHNRPLDAAYETLATRLFPNLDHDHG